MIFTILNNEEVTALKNDLKANLPGSAKIFYVLRNLLKGLLPGLEVIVDKWPDWTCIVLRPRSQEEVAKYFCHTYICHAKIVSALKYFLQRPGVIDWTQPATFTGVPRDLAPLLSAMCKKHMGTLSSVETRFMYAWTRKAIPEEPLVPDGLRLEALQPEDAYWLRKDWEGCRNREDLEGYFRSVIQNFDSTCLRDDNGDLRAYICMQYNGSMAMLYVKPEHRDKDYFKILLRDLTRKLLANGEIAYGFIPTHDTSLVSMIRELGFEWVPTGDMIWVHYEPLNLRKKHLPRGIINNLASKEGDEFVKKNVGAEDFFDVNSVKINAIPLAVNGSNWTNI